MKRKAEWNGAMRERSWIDLTDGEAGGEMEARRGGCHCSWKWEAQREERAGGWCEGARV